MLAFDNQEHQRKRPPPEDIRLLLPQLAGRPVANPTPQVDDFLPVTVHAACGPQLSSAGEVLNESVAHGIKALANVPVNSAVSSICHGHDLPGHLCVSSPCFL